MSLEKIKFFCRYYYIIACPCLVFCDGSNICGGCGLSCLLEFLNHLPCVMVCDAAHLCGECKIIIRRNGTILYSCPYMHHGALFLSCPELGPEHAINFAVYDTRSSRVEVVLNQKTPDIRLALWENNSVNHFNSWFYSKKDVMQIVSELPGNSIYYPESYYFGEEELNIKRVTIPSSVWVKTPPKLE